MRSTRPNPSNRRLKVLVGLLILSASIWGVARLARGAAPGPVPLTTDDLASVPAVVHVTARPPSLFVELSGEPWSTMSDREKVEALEAIGRIAERAGYSGVHARTEDGSSGGQWLLRGGAGLVRKSRGRT